MYIYVYIYRERERVMYVYSICSHLCVELIMCVSQLVQSLMLRLCVRVCVRADVCAPHPRCNACALTCTLAHLLICWLIYGDSIGIHHATVWHSCARACAFECHKIQAVCAFTLINITVKCVLGITKNSAYRVCGRMPTKMFSLTRGGTAQVLLATRRVMKTSGERGMGTGYVNSVLCP